jgi:simple sugar transport system permease protein
VVPAALFFGVLEAGAGAMQREAGVPSVVTELVQGAVILFSVGFAAVSGSRRRSAPDGASAEARG